jgi:hypothetical protein
MAGSTYFFVAVFFRDDTGKIRTEAIVRARSRLHATLTAASFEGEGTGAIAFSKALNSSSAQWGGTEILVRYGVLPNEHAIHRAVYGNWGEIKSERPDPAPVQVQSEVAKSTNSTGSTDPARRSLPLARIFMPRRPKGRLKLRVAATLAAALLAIVVTGRFLSSSRAAQREARLVEIARPDCSHAGTTNAELHRLVKSQYRSGVSKKDALLAVISICRAKLSLASMPD